MTTPDSRHNILGVLVTAATYRSATGAVIRKAQAGSPFGVSALAVHGVMTGALNKNQRALLNHLDLLVPDGQPVRWAMNLLYRTRLNSQVRGTALTLHILKAAAQERLPVGFYGGRRDVLERIGERLRREFPDLKVAGMWPSRFDAGGAAACDSVAEMLSASGARIVFVGIGCPRQEIFVAAMRDRVAAPLVAVGAAFDYLAGGLKDPPLVIQRWGLEWLWRLALEPRRLWRRYVLLNPSYVALMALQAARVWHPSPHLEIHTNIDKVPL